MGRTKSPAPGHTLRDRSSLKSPKKYEPDLMDEAAPCKKTLAKSPRRADRRVGLPLLVEWPNEGWFDGKVVAAAGGKYEAKFSDGSLVSFTAAQVDHWAQQAASSQQRMPKGARSSSPSRPRGKPVQGATKCAPESVPRPYGFIIVVLSAAMSLCLAQIARRQNIGKLEMSFLMCSGNAVMTLLGTWLLREYSWTDRLWSVTPFFYILYFASESQWNTRCTMMAALSFLWSVRLTWNYARKGGYVVQVGEVSVPLLSTSLFLHPCTWYHLGTCFDG